MGDNMNESRVCPKCNKVFSRQYCLKVHLEKKNKCDQKVTRKKAGKSYYGCKICKIDYSRKDYLDEHMEKNHPKEYIESIVKAEVNKKEDEIGGKFKIIIDKLDKLQGVNSNMSNIESINIDNSINNNLNVIVNPVTKENINYIDNNIMKKCVERPFYGIPKLIKIVNFNNEHPENHNIILPNKNKKIYKLFDGKEWKLRTENDTVKYLITDNTFRLERFVEINGDDYTEKQLESIIEELDNMELTIDKKDEQKEFKQLFDDIVLVINEGQEIIKKKSKEIKYVYNCPGKFTYIPEKI
jgi:hypothetical protein